MTDVVENSAPTAVALTERMVVRAKGGAAHGFFEVTEDVSQLCRADFLQRPGQDRRLLPFARAAEWRQRAWANMNGYASRTCLWENPSGLKFCVKYLRKTEQGIANLADGDSGRGSRLPRVWVPHLYRSKSHRCRSSSRFVLVDESAEDPGA
jgi:hypothetical protein